ncbi:hypothetical protein RNAN_0615 [Rheinheimera nanhaiensis E407-8]|uniref:Uncharacterized protein n=1 Tax=Rheinheimera nanhaiensis E407-8 TaxID=562729 RepID=I1DUB8_9GAMM|nr:hypothetical protein RNAN_0615 [Rheinheimera nanhaiensis E407-8]
MEGALFCGAPARFAIRFSLLRGVKQLSVGQTASKNVLDIFAEVEQSVNG